MWISFKVKKKKEKKSWYNIWEAVKNPTDYFQPYNFFQLY